EPMSSGGYAALKSGAASTMSFDYVFANYYTYVCILARTLLRNAQDVEDVTQEVFLRVHKCLRVPPARSVRLQRLAQHMSRSRPTTLILRGQFTPHS
ncbi:MAG: sigma factor, partial [Chloroflexia bacterium]